MSDELFPAGAVASKSPRLLWLDRHGIVTMSFDEAHRFGEWDKWVAGIAPGVTGSDAIAQWFCDECSRNGETTVGQGATEDDALAELAVKHGIPLWNEEPEPKPAQPHDVEHAGNY